MKTIFLLLLSIDAIAGGGYVHNPNASGLQSSVSCANGSSVNLDGNTLYVDCTNDRVGVGTASPATVLAVNGAAQF